MYDADSSINSKLSEWVYCYEWSDLPACLLIQLAPFPSLVLRMPLGIMSDWLLCCGWGQRERERDYSRGIEERSGARRVHSRGNAREAIMRCLCSLCSTFASFLISSHLSMLHWVLSSSSSSFLFGILFWHRCDHFHFVVMGQKALRINLVTGRANILYNG